MAAIEILSDLYITGQRKDSPDNGLTKMDYFDSITFLANQKPSFASKMDSMDNTKIIYIPLLGDYTFYFEPKGNYVFEDKEKALSKAEEIISKLIDLNNGGINSFVHAVDHIRGRKTGNS